MKYLKNLLMLVVVSMCIACSNTATTNSDTTKQVESKIPTDYVTTVIVTINPQIKLYLDEDNQVLYAEALNDDAKEIVETIDYKGKTVDKVVQNVVTASIDKGFITEEKGNDVNIKVDEVKSEDIKVSTLVDNCTTAATDSLKEASLTSEVKSSLSDDATKVKESQITTCTTCNGSGYICPTCNGTEYEPCRCCNSTGYEDCKTCPTSGVYNCHGCKGSGSDHGETCRYCNGSGKMTCEVCGGKHYKYKLCSRCAGFKLACPKCETAVKVCPTCNGKKEI